MSGFFNETLLASREFCIFSKGPGPHEAIAAKHNVSTALAGRVIRAAKMDKDFVKKRQQNERRKVELHNAIKHLVDGWDEDANGMLSIGRLRKMLIDETEFDCSLTTLREIMRHQLGLRFKKVKQLAPQTNRLKNVICR